MLDPPDLSDDRLTAAVEQHYGLHLTTLTFLPLGQDVRAWAYRAVSARGSTYFLKLRQGAINDAALRVPRYLVDHGVPHVVAPLPTRTQRLWADVEAFTLTLFPFITGATGGAHGWQEHHWVTYGAALRALHDTPVTTDLAAIVPRDSFTSRWPALVQAVEVALAQSQGTDPIARAVAAWWRTKRADIHALVERLEALGQRLRIQRPPLVLCHADLHPNNVLIDRDGRFWIVDWDDTLLAPKECDLMMGVGGLSRDTVGPREEAWFLAGYGPTAIDPVALAYYRHLRAVSDVAARGEQAVLLPAVSEATRRLALHWLERLFAPGYIVSLARQVDHLTP